MTYEKRVEDFTKTKSGIRGRVTEYWNKLTEENERALARSLADEVGRGNLSIRAVGKLIGTSDYTAPKRIWSYAKEYYEQDK